MSNMYLGEPDASLLDKAWHRGDHPCSLKDYLEGCHCKDCIKIRHPEDTNK